MSLLYRIFDIIEKKVLFINIYEYTAIRCLAIIAYND